MIRWALLLVGLASIAFGVIGYLMHPPIAETAAEVSVDEAIALLPGNDRIEVTVTGRLDTERRIYPALSERPGYTLHNPAETHPLPPVDAADRTELESYLGARVSLPASLEPVRVSLMGVEERTLQEDDVKSERVLAPLVGTDRRLWVLSPTFSDGGGSPDGWAGNGAFTGVLTRLADIGENTSTWSLEFSYDEIEELLTDEFGVELSGDELLVIEGPSDEPGTLFYLPVVGSAGALSVMPFYEGEALPSWTTGAALRGVMWVWDVEDEERDDLERVFGGPLPPRRGAIHHDESAAEVNAKTTLGLQLFTGLGAVLLFLSAVGFLWRRLRRRGAEN